MMRMPQRKWALAVFVGFVLLVVITVVLLRAPRMEEDIVRIADARRTQDEMFVEYRMRKPFRLKIEHGLWQYPGPSDGGSSLGIRILQPEDLRSEQVGLFEATRYDYLRGEYFIQLHVRCGDPVQLRVDGRPIDVPIWSAGLDSAHQRLSPINAGTHYGDSVGIGVLRLPLTEGREEYVGVYAGTMF